MKIKKVLNNNAVTTISKDQKEKVIIGKGVGFGKRVGDSIEESLIEKSYLLQGDSANDDLDLLRHVNSKYIEIAELIIKRVEDDFEIKPGIRILITVADYINDLIERLQNNVKINNYLKNDIKYLYRNEYEIAKYGSDLINEKIGYEIPEDEIAYLTLCLINIEYNDGSKNAKEIMRFINGINEIVLEENKLSFHEDSDSYQRYLTHLKFLAHRVTNGEKNDDLNVDEIYDVFLNKNNCLKTLDEIEKFIKSDFNYEFEKSEQVYMLIHLSKIIKED